MDKLVLPPLNFGRMFKAMKESLGEKEILQETENAVIQEKERSDEVKDNPVHVLERLIDCGIYQADEIYKWIQRVNLEYQNLESKEERKVYRGAIFEKGRSIASNLSKNTRLFYASGLGR